MKRPGSDAGETLVEILVAVVILGLAAVAILAGVALSAKTSDIHRKMSTGGSYARNYAEMIQEAVAGGGYVPCAGQNAYAGAWTPPSGYTAKQSKAKVWNGAGWVDCNTVAADNGTQQVTLTVSSSDDRASEKLTIVLRNPCSASTPCG